MTHFMLMLCRKAVSCSCSFCVGEEFHYRHYQFYANMCVATAIAYVLYRVHLDSALAFGWLDAGVLLLEVIFFMTFRDTLRKYYQRSQQLLSRSRSREVRRSRAKFNVPD